MTFWFSKSNKLKKEEKHFFVNSLQTFFFYLILTLAISIAWVSAAEFILEIGAGILFPIENFENHSNNVRQHESRDIIGWEDQYGQGLEVNGSFLITNQLAIGFGGAFYQVSEEYGPTNIINSVSYHTNTITRYFPFWTMGEYYLNPKDSQFNISFSLKLGVILKQREFFGYSNNNATPTDSFEIDGPLVSPSIKFLYGVRPYSHLFLDLQYMMIVQEYFRHNFYTGIGLKYRFRPPVPIKKTNVGTNTQFPTAPKGKIPSLNFDLITPNKK